MSSFGGLTGVHPQWLYFDSKVVPYPELSQLNQRGIWVVTIRRRGAAILRRLSALPTSQWRQAVIDTPHRRHQRIRYLDQMCSSQGTGSLRQLAVTDWDGSTRPCSCPTTPRRVRGH